jgi:uncharacterized protein HemX
MTDPLAQINPDKIRKWTSILNTCALGLLVALLAGAVAILWQVNQTLVGNVQQIALSALSTQEKATAKADETNKVLAGVQNSNQEMTKALTALTTELRYSR